MEAIAMRNKMLLATSQMMKANQFVLTQGMNHSDPVWRYCTICAITRRNMQDMKMMVFLLLDDEVCEVQQAARECLVKFTKEDFGPLPGCNEDQVQESIQAWQKYLAKGEKTAKAGKKYLK